MKVSEVAAAICVVFLFLFILGLAIQPQQINPAIFGNVGKVYAQNTQVSWNPNFTEPVTSVDWGTLQPGENKTVTVYVDAAVAVSTSNWNPGDAKQFFALTTSQIEQQLNMTLHVSPTISNVTTFSFDITLTTK